jgi:hypothetical protein
VAGDRNHTRARDAAFDPTFDAADDADADADDPTRALKLPPAVHVPPSRIFSA